MGAEKALLGIVLQKHWKRQEHRRIDMAFDAAKPSVASKISSLTMVHGHVLAALLVEMKDVRGSACLGLSLSTGWERRRFQPGCASLTTGGRAPFRKYEVGRQLLAIQ